MMNICIVREVIAIIDVICSGAYVTGGPLSDIAGTVLFEPIMDGSKICHFMATSLSASQ